MTNQEIAKLLRNVAAAYVIKDEKKFRFQALAYQNASETIENFPTQLQDLYKDGKLETVPGIGTTIKGRLEDLFKNGKVAHFDWVLHGIPPATFVLMDIPSFGPKKAYRLSEEFMLKNPDTAVSDLLKIAKKGGISGLSGFGEKSEQDIIRAINEFKLGKGKTTRMVLPYASEIADSLLRYLRKSKYVVKAEALGSLRRRSPTVGDVDIAVASKNPREVIDYFVAYPFKERVIEKGPATASLLVSGGHQIDLMVQPVDYFGSLLQHFTGSKNHNVHLRELALKKGISLSERGFKKISKSGEIIKTFDTEEKFYNALGMDWIPPEMREDTGEIELALSHKLPKIIELSDIKGDFHLHSSFPIEPSHDLGRDTIEDMVKKAIELGYSYMSFSEHNPSISKHTKKEIYNLIKQRNDEIDRVQKKYSKIKIFKSMETDILPNGSLAIDENALSLLDFTIVSVHSVFKMAKEEMTERVLKGLSHKKAKILAHPTGRLLTGRPGYELDFIKIFQFVRQTNKALEINAWPNRLDLSDAMIREAVSAKIKMVIDTDSHAQSQMALMEYGVAMARRGWATKKDVLNCLPLDEFKHWVDN